MVAYVCHVYGYLPAEVLGMAYRHFVLLYRSASKNERIRARYTAFAFNNPKQLFDSEGETAKKITKTNTEELLRACNG